MTMKSVTINIREENISSVVNHLTSLIFANLAGRITTTTDSLNKKVTDKEIDSTQYAIHFAKIIKHYKKAIEEMENLSTLYSEVPDLPTEAEVLEDLPDLEENGLGVSGGSVEPVTVTADAS
jgi:hypothetical protein